MSRFDCHSKAREDMTAYLETRAVLEIVRGNWDKLGITKQYVVNL